MSEINTEQSTTNLDGDKILVTIEPVMKTAVEALSILGQTQRLTVIGKGESCPNADNASTAVFITGSTETKNLLSFKLFADCPILISDMISYD